VLIDLHTHSYPASDDSFMSVDELILAAKERGLDGVCLTEHDAFWPPEQVAALSRRHSFLVLPGCEINTDGGHVLVFGLRRYTFGLHKPPFMRQMVEQERGAIVAAHPYRRRFLADRPQDLPSMVSQAARDPFFGSCHALEAVNGRGTAKENRFSRELAARLGAPITGGSDAHRTEQLGRAATRFQRPIASLEDLVTELRAGRYEAVDLGNHATAAPAGGQGGDQE
jgi:predicted metal-dependent phosphoesterase TrpH